jgi:multisubunit Na+/H+ antiporter MnhC subunit
VVPRNRPGHAVHGYDQYVCVGVVLIFHSSVVRYVICKDLLDVALNFIVCTLSFQDMSEGGDGVKFYTSDNISSRWVYRMQ